MEKKNIVFNYSDIELTEPMNRLLNRGLNFSILPKKLDITQVRVDYKRFKRAAIWQEFNNGSVFQMPEKPIFKVLKTNLPKNHIVPEGLKTFLNAVESDIMDPRNRNHIESNLPTDEIEALKILIKLQKDKQIVVKACDKGAGIIILTYKEYMRACYEHLTAQLAPDIPYYIPVNELAMQETKTKIINVLQEALEDNVITKQEFSAMDPEDKGVGRFYCNFKVHKQQEF